MDKNRNSRATHILDIRAKLVDIEKRARRIIDELHVNTQAEFEALFLTEDNIEAIAGHFKQKIQEATAAKKISNEEKYTTAMNAFLGYFGPGVTFNDLTADRLQAYEDWYIEQPRSKKKENGEKKSLTSVGINMRCLRHIFKRAIKRGIIPESLYPFGIGRYVIPEGGDDDTKKFMDTTEKNAFISWKHANDRLNELHDYAVFAYYANGINMSDVARLKKGSVFKEYIAIDRQKTKGRKKKNKKLIIPMHPTMQEIITRRGKKTLIPDDFVFPILEYGMEEEAIFYRIRDLVDDVNDMLAIMAKDLKLEIKPTSYTLRHTFAFHFMKLGGTTDELQDALAHGSIKTTEHYKHGFELERKKKFSDGL